MGCKWSSWRSSNNSPPGSEGDGGRWGDYYEVFGAGEASPCQSQSMTQGHFSRKMTAEGLVYFGRLDQMMQILHHKMLLELGLEKRKM